jgi:hypothetical protein
LPEANRKQALEYLSVPHTQSHELSVQYQPSFDAEIPAEHFAFKPPREEPFPDHCAELGVSAISTDAMIDDLEDGDEVIRPADQRRGFWWTFGDEGCPGGAEDVTAPPGAGNPSRFAARVGAKNCSSWGFGMGFPLNWHSGRCAYDVSAYDGVTFWARAGDGTADLPIKFVFGMRETLPREHGGDGTCEPPKCWDEHAVRITLGRDWKQYSFVWADFKQAGHGPQVAFNPKHVVALNWGADATPSTYREFWLDNVAFFKGSPRSALAR